MPSILLAPYTVRVRPRGHTDKAYLPLGNLDPGDLFQHFETLLRRLESRPVLDREGETLLGVHRLDINGKARCLEGILETGHYGYRSRLVHFETLLPSHDRKVSDAELLPFYFLLYLPKRPNQGVLLLQRLGGWGLKSAFEGEIVRHFKVTPHLVEIHPLVPKRLVTALKRASRARRIRLVSFQVPRDVAEAFAEGDRKELCADLVIRARGRRSFKLPSSLHDLVHGDRSVGGFVEAQGEFPHSRLQVDVAIGKKTHKVSFDQKGRDMTGYHDVTGSVTIEDGHPTYDSIRGEAWVLLARVKKQIQSVAPPIAAPAPNPLPAEVTAPAAPEDRRRTG